MSTSAEDFINRHRHTVKEFHRMGEVGILHPSDRVELIEGEIIDMAPIGSLHAATVAWLNSALMHAVGDLAVVWVQNPVFLDNHSEPQPSLALLKPRADFFASSHPAANDVPLLVEVSDSTLRYDREIKIPLYARHGIPEVWLVDVNGKEVTRYGGLQNEQYALVETLRVLSGLSVAQLPGVLIDLSGVMRMTPVIRNVSSRFPG